MILESTIMLRDDCYLQQPGSLFDAIYFSLDLSTGLYSLQANVGSFEESAVYELPGECVNFLAKYRDWPGGAEVDQLISWLIS